MSQSHRPTRAPVCSSATARLAATVDLPTPPLPLATAITCLTPGICVVAMPAPAPPGGAWISIKTFAVRTPSMPSNARSASFLIAAGTFGSFVANASCTFTSPLSIWMDFTNPKETISRVKPGYFTDFNAVFTCSSEIDMLEPYVRRAKRKRGAGLSLLIVQFVANLIIASARWTSRLLAGFRDEVRGLPLGPGAVFRPHRIGWQMELEDSVFTAG